MICRFLISFSERYDHPTQDDHNDEVISVSGCSKMRLFATASLDGTVRIWDESNHLKRVIKLNATPSAISFCSERGDLMVSIGNSLHRIKYATCKTTSLLFSMLSNLFHIIYRTWPCVKITNSKSIWPTERCFLNAIIINKK